MKKELFDQIVDFLLPEMDDLAVRKELVQGALAGSPVLRKVQWDGAADTFTKRLVRQLEEFGQIAPGRPALVALLEEVKRGVGLNRQAEAEKLLAELRVPASVSLPDQVFAEGELYVFISYARPDQAIAAQVEAFLKAAGVRTFRDVTDIPSGANWDQTIGQALRECQRMVLLLSTSSMPYRKEVYNEWFPFDQMKKTIHPLYLEACELDRRFVGVNYIDARASLQGALDRLLADLRR